MSREDIVKARRNAAALGGTTLVLGLLLLYPTSTNRMEAPRRPGTPLAPAGVVVGARLPGAPSASPTAQTVTINGTSVDTPYGPVQVQLKVRGRKVLAATAIDYPQNGGQSQAINSQAVPALEQETLAAQSARIDTISGATFTSEGYRQSLQAALDAAHLT
jgi:uncharacterized protein with FMN-binding domain